MKRRTERIDPSSCWEQLRTGKAWRRLSMTLLVAVMTMTAQMARATTRVVKTSYEQITVNGKDYSQADFKDDYGVNFCYYVEEGSKVELGWSGSLTLEAFSNSNGDARFTVTKEADDAAVAVDYDYEADPNAAGYLSGGHAGASFTMPAGDVHVDASVLMPLKYSKADGTIAVCRDYTLLQNDVEFYMQSYPSGWYVCKGSFTINHQWYFEEGSDVHIIICDDTNIELTDDNLPFRNQNGSVTVYGQTNGGGTTGSLTLSTKEDYAIKELNGFTICGGHLIAKNKSLSFEAINLSCDIKLYGGKLTANNTDEFYYIGIVVQSGGQLCLNGGTLECNKRINSASDPTIASGLAYIDDNNDIYTTTIDKDLLHNRSNITLEPRKDFTLCTAVVPNPIYHSGYTHNFFYEGTWNDNHGGIEVYDGETLLTYYHYDSEKDDYVGDYRFKDMESLDGGNCENLNENCRVYLEGLGDYAGVLYKDVVIVPATVTNESWGSLKWSLDADGNFTISGTGAMNAATTFRNYTWYNYCSYFKTITIGEGITTVAAGAFGGDSNTNPYAAVTTVNLPSTLTTIGDNAFAYCTGLTSLTIPASVKTVGANAFNQCNSLDEVYCFAAPFETWQGYETAFKTDPNNSNNKTTFYVTNADAWTTAYPTANVTYVGATPVSYIDENGKEQSCWNYTELRTNDNNLDFDNLPGGWYVVKNWNTNNSDNNGVDFYRTGDIIFNGDTHLILCDGAEMNVSKDDDGTTFQSEGTLTIYGQVGGTGTLTLNSNQTTISVIGNLTICSGSVSATSSGDDVINTTGDIILKGGTLTACADDGTSRAINCSGTLNLSGGKVVATKGAIYAENGATIASGLAYTNGSTAYTTSISSNDLEALGAVTLELADIVITSANFAQYFDYIGDFEYNNATPNTSTTGGYFLKDGVPVGSTLDFQGEFIPDVSGNYNSRIFINKRVNITSSDKSAVFKPYTNEDGYEQLWWNFGILEGADYTVVKNLKFRNCWVFNHGSSYVTFDGIDMKVEDVRIGSGIGALSICTIKEGGHASDHTTVKNSVFYTRNNGGSTSLMAGCGAPYITFDSNTVTLEGNVGNGIYASTYNTFGDKPEYGTFTNNVVTNEGPAKQISWCIIPCGQGNLIENNTVNYAGNAINIQYGSSVSEEQKKNIYRNNTTTLGGSISVYEYSVVENNQVSGQLTVAKGATATGNTVAKMTVSGQDATVKGNTVNGSTTISGTNVTFQGNTVNGNTTISKTTASFTDNAINGMLTLDSGNNRNNNNTITGNVILSTMSYAVELKSLDNTVSGNILISADHEGNDAVHTTKSNTIADNTLAAYEEATASSQSNAPYIISSETTAIKAGDNAGTFYYVPTDATVTINGDLAITPNEGATSPKVNLMLGNGSQLNVGNISGSDCSLTLYGQSMDGMLTATGTISAKNINLNGATVTANDYSGTVNIASGKTYYDGTGASYTGTLTSSEVTAIVGKTLRTYDYRTVEYVKADGTEGSADAIPLTGGGATTLAAGWYVVNSNVNYEGGITLGGDVNLILADGCTMNIGTIENPVSSCGIYGIDHSISIYAQSMGNSKGRLHVNALDNGISVKGINICGGEVMTVSVNVDGISTYNGNITIYNGHVTSEGVYGLIASGDITINGGQVSSTGSSNGGTAIYAINSNITINGGEVSANGGFAGIESEGNITINGGEVSVNGSEHGGLYAVGGNITLGWTSADDRIYASSYEGTLTIAAGKVFTDGTDIYDDATPSATLAALTNKTLQPAVKITLPTGVTATGTGVITQTDGTYALPGATATISAATDYIISNVNATGADLTDNGDDTYTFTVGTTDVTVTATVITNIVTQDNFYSYFDVNDHNGYLLDAITFDELIFQGEFSNLVDYILLDRSITITGDNAVLNNMGFAIVSDDVSLNNMTLVANSDLGYLISVHGSDVTLDNVSVTYNAPNDAEAKAIFADCAENFALTNSEIIFTGADPGEDYYRGLEVRNCDGAVIDKNTITATFPAVPVNWGETGIDQDLVLAVGIQGGNDVEFTNNSVTVNTNGDVGSYTTIDAVMVYSANDILIKGNDITHVDNTTENGARYYYTLDIYSTTGTVEANKIMVNTTPSIDRSGSVFPIQLTGPFTVTVKDNNITAISKGPVAGIYATNWPGESNLTAENNIINVTGYATTSNYALVAGIEAEIGITSELDRVMVYNNTITVDNAADYDDANQVIGVGIGTSWFSGDASADIKYNDITVDGKYAVYYAKAKNTNVTGNNLIAHELKGNDAVYIADGSGNTVENNVPATLFAAGSTNQWMTWCGTKELVTPENVTVYTVTGINNEDDNHSIILDDVTTTASIGTQTMKVIPAYTPVLIYRETVGNDALYGMFKADVEGESGVQTATGTTGCTFYGTTTALEPGDLEDYYAEGQTYILGGDKFIKADTNEGIAANKCWLVTATNGARQLSIVIGDGTTAIDNGQLTIDNWAGAEEWYTIDGRKLNGKPTKKGLYINNGKKTVIK